MANRIHVELEGPAPVPVAVIINGELQSDVTGVHANVMSNPPGQFLTLDRVAAPNGRLYYSQEAHKITKATLTIEYEEATVEQHRG